MRKVYDGEKNGEKENMMFIVATNATASQLSERRLLMPIPVQGRRGYSLTAVGAMLFALGKGPKLKMSQKMEKFQKRGESAQKIKKSKIKNLNFLIKDGAILCVLQLIFFSEGGRCNKISNFSTFKYFPNFQFFPYSKKTQSLSSPQVSKSFDPKSFQINTSMT